LSTEAPISPLISRAASALRCARERTSLATTAAFSARMLVWNAIPSITPMMSAIFFEATWISSIVVTTCATTAPPRHLRGTDGHVVGGCCGAPKGMPG